MNGVSLPGALKFGTFWSRILDSGWIIKHNCVALILCVIYIIIAKKNSQD